MRKMKMWQVSCGAINPYALLASRTGKRISRNLTPNRLRQKFEDEFGIPVHHMFDPAHGSPLFAHSKHTKLPRYGMNIETGEPAVRCSQAVNGWAPFTGSFLSSPPPDVNDTNQGCSLDCWFMSALASVTWVWPDLIHNYYPATNPNTYLRFYKANHAAGATPPYMPPAGGNLWSSTYAPAAQYIKSSYALPYGSTVGNFVYASPNPATPATLWPALFEKSYGDFYQLSGSANDTPDISTFGTGNPLNSLIHLTGKRYYTQGDVTNAANQGVTLSETAFFITEFADSNSVFNTIYNKCYTPSPGQPAMTVTPMVAWTYPTADIANSTNGVDPSADPADSVQYNNEAIVAQHCYSILGVQIVNGTNYIVLRNPWGMSTCGGYGEDPDIIPGSADDQYASSMNASIITSYTGTDANSIWTVNLLPSSASNYNTCLGGALSRTVDLRNADGIFALTFDKFRLHFQAFGWGY